MRNQVGEREKSQALSGLGNGGAAAAPMLFCLPFPHQSGLLAANQPHLSPCNGWRGLGLRYDGVRDGYGCRG